MNKYLFRLSLFLVIVQISLYPMEEQEKKDQLIKNLSSLVSFDTVTTNIEGNKQALNWVNEQLRPLGLYYKFHQYGGFNSLVITTKKTMSPKLWLVAHMDVVAAPEKLFHPIIQDGKMYGRGVFDMKMAIACYMLLMNDLKDKLLDYDIGIMLTSDEEIGGFNGVNELLKAGYSSDVAFLPDSVFNWKLEKAAKGVLQLKVESRGKSAHSSTPWKGENAIEKLMVVLGDIQKYFEGEKISDYYPTSNIGKIQGGKSTNQVPDNAFAEIDIRYPPSMQGDDIYKKIVEIANYQNNVSIEKLKEGLPNKVDLNLNYFQKFRDLAKKMYEIEVDEVSTHGSSDARFFSQKHIPVLLTAPKGGEIHSDQEWIDLDDLLRFYNVMKAWVTKAIR